METTACPQLKKRMDKAQILYLSVGFSTSGYARGSEQRGAMFYVFRVAAVLGHRRTETAGEHYRRGESSG